MRLVLEKRLEQSRLMLIMTPILSVIGVMIIGVILFDAIGFDGFDAVWQLFITPVIDSYKWRDVATKAAPLILIGLGLSIGNRAKIWNIGAEGQYIVGALSAAGIAVLTQDLTGFWIIPLMLLGGMVGCSLRGRARCTKDALWCERGPFKPHACLCIATTSFLSHHGSLERSEWYEFPANRTTHRSAIAAT